MSETLYTRMLIGESNDDGQAVELAKKITEYMVDAIYEDNTPGLVGYQVNREEDGRMVVLTMSWTTREAMVRYHCSRAYRVFVANTQYLIVGDFVIRMFETVAFDHKPV